MIQKFRSYLFPALALTMLAAIALAHRASATPSRGTEPYGYLPVVNVPLPSPTPTPSPTPSPTPTSTPLPAGVEFRGMWVTRFDWTSSVAPASKDKIDEIVNNADFAGFNAILFQVRANADAYYTPGLEPWARRVSGTFGQPPNPVWDPLGYMIQQAHAKGIEVHAYFNVYPVWDDCENPPDEGASPRHFYYLLRDQHGLTGNKLNGLQWFQGGNVACSGYWRSSPASVFGDNHMLAVSHDLITRYNIDGLHLDHIRYGGSTTSCDPVSQSVAGVTCFTSAPAGYESWESWQRAQVNGTVFKFYEQILDLDPNIMLSAAVWPIYIDYWNWGGLEGYHDYYQDSKEWIQEGYIDAIMPMIYPASYDCPDDSFWTQSRWQTLVNDFQAASSGRFVIPGIGSGYCTFDEIAFRINAARAAGTAGHAIFSYSSLRSNGYFDDLAAGPYAAPATVPEITWHNRQPRAPLGSDKRNE